MPKKTPEIPSASLADIAFLLLIFFMVTTTMDVDSGLERRLPPLAPDVENKDTPPIKERNVFIVLVNKDNQFWLRVNGCRLDEFREKAKEFMANPNNSENLPEKEVKEVDIFRDRPISAKGSFRFRTTWVRNTDLSGCPE